MHGTRTASVLLTTCLLALPVAAAAAAAGDDRARADAARPAWAKADNFAGNVAGTVVLERLGLVLRRSPERKRAYDAYLDALQDPASPDYQRWLDSDEIGARFGAEASDIAAVSAWLRAQGLQVDAVSPTRRILRFGARAADVERLFGTRLDLYGSGAAKRMAPAGVPILPAAIADKVERIDGLETLRVEPTLHGVARRDSASLRNAAVPKGTSCGDGVACEHFVFPADFAVIYGLESAYDLGYDGEGQSIAIVARARVHTDDVVQFRSLSALPAMEFTTIIADDGVDPGPAVDGCGGTGQPSCDDVGDDDDLLDQMEATLDVTRAGGTAPGAQIKLVTSGEVGNVDGVLIALEHAVYAQPPPARIISISFGTCEADNSAGAAAYLDEVFADAAMQGISVFVSSGDSGSSDCALHLDEPNGDQRQSVNILCSSSHVTCVGGTQFAEGRGTYWSLDNGPGFLSALGYIPEAAWNEPGPDSDGTFDLAATGGGVSTYIPTPDWQIGAGVPAERDGRYLPDVALGASSHTGYFTCMAAYDASCIVEDGRFRFMRGAGTSAAAPSMAAIAALLNQRTNSVQGNLNPRLYALAGNPANGVFHDVSIASSGVSRCDADIPSPCNNATPGPDSLEGGATGHLLEPLHDLATGLGSVDAMRLLAMWNDDDAAGIPLNQRGLIGSWANPATAGQGVLLDIEPDFYGEGAGLLFGGWFTYHPSGRVQQWLTLQGQVNSNGAAVMPVYATVGGAFDSAQPTTTHMVGTATVSFQDCSHGRIDYDLPYDGEAGDGFRGSIPVTRLLSDVSCSPQGTPVAAPRQHALAGAWADPGNSGQGLVIDIDPEQGLLFAAWYTFAANGSPSGDLMSLLDQRWLTLQAELPRGANRLERIGVFDTTGGAFDGPADTATTPIGEADLEFHSCSSATLRYRLSGGGLAGRSGALALSRITPVPPGCHL